MRIKDLDKQSSEVKAALEEYVKNPYGFFLLTGTNGTGKSACAMAIYEALCPYILPAYDHSIAMFVTQADLNSKWSSKSNEGKGFLLEEIQNTKLLIIDDLGTRTPTDAFMDFLYSIADSRYTNRKSKGTIITTNLTHSKMREKMTDAFASRINSGKILKFVGKDLRKEEDSY